MTVDANGVPIGLELAERTRELAGSRLSAEILGCMRQAQARLRERVRDLVADTVPVDDEPARNLMTQYEQRFPGVIDEHTGEEDDRIGELPEEHARHEEPPRRPTAQDTPGRDDDEWDDQSPLRG